MVAGAVARSRATTEPDSGNPTVLDERGAAGNVSYGSRAEVHWETCG